MLVHTGQSMLCSYPVLVSDPAASPCQLPCSLQGCTATCISPGPKESTHMAQPGCGGGRHSALLVVNHLTESILWTWLALYAECADKP